MCEGGAVSAYNLDASVSGLRLDLFLLLTLFALNSYIKSVSKTANDQMDFALNPLLATHTCWVTLQPELETGLHIDSHCGGLLQLGERQGSLVGKN
jgi:hypothetical protein